ncbi:MAG TPA: type II toxin-antitoxin system RelE/ParE family toxin [Rhizomicrobium sp.]|nr:type II toxin-antitoxin system RelE/ParE family toxin [Rhizomicrobium sp.]
MSSSRWNPRLSEQAKRDLRGILKWTKERFGEVQATSYHEAILTAFSELHNGPDLPSIKRRDDLSPGVMVFRIARKGRQSRHIIVFKVAHHEEKKIEVLRIPHDSMDLQRHLSFQEEPKDFD